MQSPRMMVYQGLMFSSKHPNLAGLLLGPFEGRNAKIVCSQGRCCALLVSMFSVALLDADFNICFVLEESSFFIYVYSYTNHKI